MPEHKTGPVKPPTIDLEARQKSESAKPGQSEGQGEGKDANKTGTQEQTARPGDASKPGGPSKTAASGPRPAPADDSGDGTGLPVTIAVFGGAVLGLAFAYGLAYVGYWPQPAATAAMDSRLSRVEARLSQTQADMSDLDTRLQAARGVSPNDMARVEQNVAGLAARLEQLPATDVEELRQELAALSDRVSATAADASTADADAIAEQLGAIAGEIDDLSARIETAGVTLSDLQARLQTLETADRPPAGAREGFKLTLALAGLENAVDSGTPYAAELQALQAILPDLAIPEPIAANAETGLPGPHEVERAFADAVPGIMRAQPLDAEAGWQDVLLERAKSLLALRPSEPVEGDTPEAVVSRIEAALGRGDYVDASSLLASLPEPMREAAGDTGARIAELAAATQFLDEARRAGLALDEAGQQ